MGECRIIERGFSGFAGFSLIYFVKIQPRFSGALIVNSKFVEIQTITSFAMKHANSIFKICMGITAIVLSVAAFNLTIPAAHASPPDEPACKTGKYQMTMTCVKSGDNEFTWTALIWNTETGSSYTYSQQGPAFSTPRFRSSGSDAD
jgi:hypothetical protein